MTEEGKRSLALVPFGASGRLPAGRPPGTGDTADALISDGMDVPVPAAALSDLDA